MKKKYLSCAVSFMLSVGAEAAPLSWTGNTNGWSDEQNWDADVSPGENDSIYIDSIGDFPIISEDTSVQSINNNYLLVVNNAELTVANTLRVGADATLPGGTEWDSLTGRLVLSNATVNAAEITVGAGQGGYTGFLNAVSSEINTDKMYIGYLYGTGHAALTDSKLTADGIAVGINRGKGQLDIHNSEVSTSSFYIGYTMGQGVVNVDNSRVSVFGGVGTSLVIGERDGGDGILNITNGGIVTTDSLAAGVSGGRGEINISGQGSSLSANSLTLARSGSGIMTVSDGGEVNTVSQLMLTGSEKSDGVLNIGNNDAPGYINARVINFGTGTGTINFSHTSDDYQFLPQITGNGTVNIWSGSTTLLGSNDYTGNTYLHGGYLRAGNNNALSAGSDYDISKDAALDLNGYDQTTGTINNSGTLYMNQAGTSAGTSLTVNGDYNGYGGTLVFNTVLEGDDSVTDHMHVTGNTSGTTNVQVNNLGGHGSETVEGIELISVDGHSDGDFVQSGRIVAGAYDYRLVQGGDGGNSNNWYLTSGTEPVEPPVNPGPPVNPLPELPEPPLPPEPPVIPETSTSRPEAGSYMTNLAAAQDMFVTRLEDRAGDRLYTDPFTGKQETTSLWLHTTGQHLDTRDSSRQLKTEENRFSFLLGGDIFKGSFTGTDSLSVGLMAGYGNSHNTTHASLTGYRSEGNVNGYSTGIYATWFQNADQRTGAYLDSWLQYGWFRNSVQGEGLQEEKYNASGLQASVESGYTFHLGGDSTKDFFLQPQGQLLWSGISMEDHQEANGTRVYGQGDDRVQTRLGMKAFMEVRDDARDILWKPYVATNWLHANKATGTRMDDVTLYVAGQKDVGEIKMGLESGLNSGLKVNASVVSRFGNDSYRDSGAIISLQGQF